MALANQMWVALVEPFKDTTIEVYCAINEFEIDSQPLEMLSGADINQALFRNDFKTLDYYDMESRSFDNMHSFVRYLKNTHRTEERLEHSSLTPQSLTSLTTIREHLDVLSTIEHHTELTWKCYGFNHVLPIDQRAYLELERIKGLVIGHFAEIPLSGPQEGMTAYIYRNGTTWLPNLIRGLHSLNTLSKQLMLSILKYRIYRYCAIENHIDLTSKRRRNARPTAAELTQNTILTSDQTWLGIPKDEHFVLWSVRLRWNHESNVYERLERHLRCVSSPWLTRETLSFLKPYSLKAHYNSDVVQERTPKMEFDYTAWLRMVTLTPGTSPRPISARETGIHNDDSPVYLFSDDDDNDDGNAPVPRNPAKSASRHHPVSTTRPATESSASKATSTSPSTSPPPLPLPKRIQELSGRRMSARVRKPSRKQVESGAQVTRQVRLSDERRRNGDYDA